MSHQLAPEVTISSTPLLMELCSDSFRLEAHELTLSDLETAAQSIREACRVTSQSINNAKANILMAFMADPACKRWLKKEFQKRVDCDNALLNKVAREMGFKFYTAEAIIIEELEECGPDAPVEVIADRAGATKKAVERVVAKLEKKREEELLAEQIAIEVAMASDKDDSPREPSHPLPPDPVQRVEAELVEADEPEEQPEVADHDDSPAPVAEVRPSAEPAALKVVAKTVPGIEHVKAITTKVKKKIEADYLKEIEILKNMLAEKDAEIERLKGLLAEKAE